MINDFKVEVTLTSDEGVVYVFENATLPKYVLQAVDTFSDEVEQGLELDYSYIAGVSTKTWEQKELGEVYESND